jgi:hypothetical protein
MSGIFKIREILAAMHIFPEVISATEHVGNLEALGELSTVSSRMTKMNSALWLGFSPLLSSILKREFTSLAGEQYPDWVLRMEAKYGATQTVPPMYAEIKATLQLSA